MNYELLVSFLIAFAGGILPALIWLWFWLKHDDEHPEPNKLIITTFLLGMLAVPIAFFVQVKINNLLIGTSKIENIFISNYLLAIITIIVWVAIEEILKYGAAYLGGLSKKENDEPIDPIVYLITAALGFAALENFLYVLGPILSGKGVEAFITANMRFVGATLVHVSSSAIIGIFIGLSYYHNEYQKQRYLITGFILAIILHTVFNSFIIRGGMFRVLAFAIIWFATVIAITFFERVRQKHRVET